MTSPDQTTDVSSYTGSWVLDPGRTSIEIHTKAIWVFKVKATAQALEGHGSVAADGNITGAIVIDAASVDTKNAKRDEHLRTADFFEVENHPTITFEATSGHLTSAGQVELTGTFTVRGQARPLSVLANVTPATDAVTLSAEVDIDRSDWGLSWAKMGAQVKNHVVISAYFTKA
jgi:polyisoprenoid-binding protein YceI